MKGARRKVHSASEYCGTGMIDREWAQRRRDLHRNDYPYIDMTKRRGHDANLKPRRNPSGMI